MPPSENNRVTRRLRWYWERTRPIARPRYASDTPRVGRGPHANLVVRPTAQTLAHAALSREAADGVGQVFARLTSSDELVLKQLLFGLAQEKFGAHWQYADLHTALWAAAILLQPESYLEVGVCRGWSTAVVASATPTAAIYGFDLWDEQYRGIDVPGPDFIRSELRAAGHVGDVTLVAGDSASTVPRFLSQHPDLYFDIVTFDGAKSVRAVASDFTSVLPRLKVGGIVLFDDMVIVPTLRRVWEKLIAGDGRFVTWEFRDGGFGVAAAIRVSDHAPLPIRLLDA